MLKKPRWLLVASVSGLLIACTPIQPKQATPLPPQAPAGAVTPTAGTPVPTVNGFTLSITQTITQENTMTLTTPSANPIVDQAVKDLARTLNLSLDQITLVSAEAVIWPDGALGCPRPGMSYPQVRQDGMRIILRANGQEYHYHSGESRPPFLCENPAPSR